MEASINTVTTEATDGNQVSEVGELEKRVEGEEEAGEGSIIRDEGSQE